MAKLGQAALVMALLALEGGIVRAQTAPVAPSPLPAVAPAPAVPIQPLTAGPINAPPALAPGPDVTAPTPSMPADAPPLTAPATPEDGPFYTRWWFWTAVGAVAVTTAAVLIATSASGSTPPHTDFGNMPAF